MRNDQPSEPVALRPPRGPTRKQWERLSAAEQRRQEDDLGTAFLRYQEAVRASLSAEERLAMAETEEYQDSTVLTREALRSYFGRQGRSLFVASNLTVLYPDEDAFEPDLLAVWDVPIRLRHSYVVTHEGKGLDLAIEVLYKGDRKKDLVTNVTRYARLGIREYFVADLSKRTVHAYRLDAATHRYTPLLGDLGRYRSEVLGLDVTIEQGRLRFYSGTAVVPLLREEAAAAWEQAAAAREEAAAAEERADAAQEQARAAVARLAESLLTILRLRGLVLSDAQLARVRTCADGVQLSDWIDAATTAVSADAVFAGASRGGGQKTG